MSRTASRMSRYDIHQTSAPRRSPQRRSVRRMYGLPRCSMSAIVHSTGRKATMVLISQKEPPCTRELVIAVATSLGFIVSFLSCSPSTRGGERHVYTSDGILASLAPALFRGGFGGFNCFGSARGLCAPARYQRVGGCDGAHDGEQCE